ncbi:FG-GAP repeat domain-containing protein [Candidatus Magnetomonas plexicatena]|uniref:FG-GAP repeat domain-containing protein n=1 Tax=Candidatus Magnetomonas plexicatena TaxID=2552947 RepID=UPI001C76F76B|nr:VCBS repeat-containing protein [Nitrospirales bacterium LBB_01]
MKKVRILAIPVLLLLLIAGNVEGGGALWHFPEKLSDYVTQYGDISTPLVFGDIKGDGKSEIIFGTKKGYLFALEQDGKRVKSLKVGDSIKVQPMLINLERDTHPDIVVFSRLSEYDKPAKESLMVIVDGKTFTKKLEVKIEGSVVSKPAVADFDNDGNVDFLVSGHGLYLIDGAYLTNMAAPQIHSYSLTGVSFTSPVVDDFNDDGISDFLIPYSNKNQNFIDVFLSTGKEFGYEKVTFQVSGEMKVLPTVIKTADDATVKWLVIAPHPDNSLSTYTLSWSHETEKLSLKFSKRISSGIKNDSKNQIPLICETGKDCRLMVRLTDNSTVSFLDPVSGKSDSSANTIPQYENIPIYLKGDNDKSVSSNLIFIEGATLNAYEHGKTIKLAPVSAEIPKLDKIYLFPLSKEKGREYALIGSDGNGTIWFDGGNAFEAKFYEPNEQGYLNQGVYPLKETSTLFEETDNFIDIRNESHLKDMLKLMAQLYPGNPDFRKKIDTLKTRMEGEAVRYAKLGEMKDSLRKRASKYDYFVLVQWLLSDNIETTLNYVVKQDPEFLEEARIAGFYKDLGRVKSFLKAFFPIASGILILVAIVLIIFNYTFFIKIYLNIFDRLGTTLLFKKLIREREGIKELNEYLEAEDFFKWPLSQKTDFRFRIFLALLLKEKDCIWLEVLTTYEKAVLDSGSLKDQDRWTFYRYLSYLYKRLFYKKIHRGSPFLWLVFQIRHSLSRDFYDYPDKGDVEISILKFELARVFMNMNEYKPAFNYFHKLVLKYDSTLKVPDPDSDVLRFLEFIPEKKLENYLINYRRHFFSRVRGLTGQLKVLSFYRLKNLNDKLTPLINSMCEECFLREALPRVIVSNYTPIDMPRVHGAFLTIKAFNRLKRTGVILRCIFNKYKSLSIGLDAEIKALPNSFARVINVHANKRWTVLVEQFLPYKSLKRTVTEGVTVKEAGEILISLAEHLLSHKPGWFVPNLHPSFIFRNGDSIHFAATGISKVNMDRIYLKTFKERITGELSFIDPDFIKTPAMENVLSSKQAIEKNTVALLGLIGYYLTEGHPLRFVSGEHLIQLTKCKNAGKLINSALSPPNERISLSEFCKLARETVWET